MNPENGTGNDRPAQTSDLMHIPGEMRALPQWCVTPGTAEDKAPRNAKHGPNVHASVTDPTTWVDFETACRVASERAWMIGFVYTAADPYACVDMDVKDDTPPEQLLRYERIVKEFGSYTEASRSGRGFHILLRGNIGAGCRRDGVEVYSQERFLICTGNAWLNRPIADRQEMLANMVTQMRPESYTSTPLLDQPEKEDDNAVVVRAINAANAEKFDALTNGRWQDAYPSQSEADMALMSIIAFYSPNNAQCRRIFRTTELGKREKATKDDRYLNLTLKQIRKRQSDEQRRTDLLRSQFEQGGNDTNVGPTGQPDLERQPMPMDFAKTEDTKMQRKEAKASRGTPTSPKPTSVDDINIRWAMRKGSFTSRLEYLIDPYLPARCVVGFFGRGSTAKSSFLATLAAQISEDYSTLWISAEEHTDWIVLRHLHAGGDIGTLAVHEHRPNNRDAQGRVIGSTFDVYRDLESAILKAKQDAGSHYIPPRSLRFVVLDTAVGLTGWAKGESPNDDAAVKRLLGYLQALAEAHDLCIAIIGHSNKGTHDHFADSVAGSSAWTNTPRLSFIHARDRREEYAYVVRVAKSNLSSSFATAYTTEPVHELYRHDDGHASVVCKVRLEPVVWGEEESMELFEAATRNPEDDNGKGSADQRVTLVEKVLKAVVEFVHSSSTPVTREMVETELGREVSRRDWKKVDQRLNTGAFQHKVDIVTGTQNKILYQRQA